ncbi:MAG: matrixin family metalloprotease [Oligoflexia bacterium]|nr:matrixin family metalloprotease [Oligoflexia bacterium]
MNILLPLHTPLHKFTLTVILLFFATKSFSFTLNNNVEAIFKTDYVTINISNTPCNNIGRDNNRLMVLVQETVDKFWNRVPTKRLSLSGGKIIDVDQNLRTAPLCVGSSLLKDSFATTKKYLYMDDHIFYYDEDGKIEASDSIRTKANSESYGCTLNPLFGDPYFDASILLVCSANTTDFPLGSSSLAVAVPLIDSETKNIRSGIILINDTNINNGNNSNNNAVKNLSDEELKSVLAHEIGHALGLGHSPTDVSLMYYMLTPNRTALSFDDIDAITYLYPNKLELFGTKFCGQISIDNKDNKKDINIGNGNNTKYAFIFFVNIFIGLFITMWLYRFYLFIYSNQHPK